MSESWSDRKVVSVASEIGEFMEADEPLFDWEKRLAGGSNSPLAKGLSATDLGGGTDEAGPVPPPSVLSFWERLRARPEG